MGASLNTDRGLELRFLWGDVRLDERFLTPGRAKRFTVGSSEGCDFAMAGSRFEAITTCDDGYAVRFTKRMRGELTRGTTTIDLVQAVARGDAERDGETYALPLGPKDRVRVDLGGIVMEAFPQQAPKPVAASGDGVDYTTLNIALTLLFAVGLFAISAANRVAEGDALTDELSTRDPRIVSLAMKAPSVQHNPILQRLETEKNRGARGGERAPGPAGKAGKPDPRKPPDRRQAQGLVASVFGGHGIAALLSPTSLGTGLVAAMAGMVADAPKDASGFGGMWIKGTGSGGGGSAHSTSIGRLDTRGRGTGNEEYGAAVTLKGKQTTEIVVVPATPVVVGSLDRDLIRDVIRLNRNQIVYCYENELTRAPNLSGKVSVKFIIGSYGAVTLSQVDHSTAGHRGLESCVAGKILGWQFPKPKGGGVVVVTYPFVFARAGE